MVKRNRWLKRSADQEAQKFRVREDNIQGRGRRRGSTQHRKMNGEVLGKEQP